VAKEKGMAQEPVWIVTRDSEETDLGGEKSWKDWGEKATSRLHLKPVDPELLQREWNRTMNFLGQLIRQAEQQAGGEFGMQLDEVTLSVEINSRGQVTLLGACTAEASGKGAITLKFKRTESK
jgi:hypothetical protein